MRRAVQRYGDSVIDEIKRIVLETAQLIQSEAKARAAVDEGALRDSIEMEIFDGGLRAVVRVTSEYAIYVEHGTGIYAEGPGGSRAKKIPWSYYSEKLGRWVTTSGMRSQPFWFPALDAGRRYFQNEMRRLGR